MAKENISETAKQNVEKEPSKLALFTGNYKKRGTWRGVATGRIIAAADFFAPSSVGSLVTDGRVPLVGGTGITSHTPSGYHCGRISTAEIWYGPPSP